MPLTLPNIGLKVWNAAADLYNRTQLSDNWQRIDEHDHSPGKGRLLGTGSFSDGALTTPKIADGAVSTAKIADAAVTPDKLSGPLAGYAGVSTSGAVRRGKCIVATAESTSSKSYVALTTPDRVSNVVLATDGLIHIAYQAQVKESLAAHLEVAIFLGATQLKTAQAETTTDQRAWSGYGATNAINKYRYLSTTPNGLSYWSSASGVEPGAVPTTGLIVGSNTALANDLNGATGGVGGGAGGVCCVWAAAGTYTVEVRYRDTPDSVPSATITAKERRLWVWTMGF